MPLAAEQIVERQESAPGAAPSPPDGHLIDARFRRLVGEIAWKELPEPVRRRFSKSLNPGVEIIYRGDVVQTEISIADRVLGHLARAIGAPLPLEDGATGPSVVTVREDAGAAGQSRTRTYARRDQTPQTIRSMKCFTGPTGLEEHVGGGFGMALRVTVEHHALHFRSTGFFVRIFNLTLPLPGWLSPGAMEIVHRQENDGRFAFQLTLTHPVMGRLLHQLAYFSDPWIGLRRTLGANMSQAPRNALAGHGEPS